MGVVEGRRHASTRGRVLAGEPGTDECTAGFGSSLSELAQGDEGSGAGLAGKKDSAPGAGMRDRGPLHRLFLVCEVMIALHVALLQQVVTTAVER
eukprot:366149-Chlamydomonas_euryale.AAC.2